MTQGSILILFTTSFPYDVASEQTFISRELPHLVERFEKVILVPKQCKGTKFSFPSTIDVDVDYADFLRQNSSPFTFLKQVLTWPYFFQEICRSPGILFYPSKILKLILFSGRAQLTRLWVVNWLQAHHIDTRTCVLYSYWLDHAAAGLGLVKQEFPQIKVVSRAHGFDIYEKYYYPYYWPNRRETLKALDALFLASHAGKNYFLTHYPEFSSRYQTSHLGVPDPGCVSRASDDNVFRIVSCSNVVPIKRLNLLLNGIALAARLRPDQKFEWIHFGGGKGLQALEKGIYRNFPQNVTGRLLGYLPNEEIMRYYKDNPVDVFVNVSKSEGGSPVSIQEAISCGIPVVAASVGGNPEIVSEKNGILLSPNPTPREIALALLQLWDNPQLTAKMRKESRRIWQEEYNAERNFHAFAERLKAIWES